jgi:ankyrin repeat protein
LHLLAENFAKSNQFQSQFAKLFEDTSLKGCRLTIPIIQDIDGLTPLDICLKKSHLNINMAAFLLKSIKDYTQLHSSHLLSRAVCKAITHDVPGIADFLDSRLVHSASFGRGHNGVTVTIKAELEREINNLRIGWGEFSILPNREVVHRDLF